MNRRKFVFGGAALALAPSSAFAMTERCSQPFPTQVGPAARCEVGIPVISTPPQACQYWCWAACCQAIFGLAGFSVDQTLFVRKIFGGALQCQPATGPAIKQAIDGGWTDARGQSFTAQCGIVMDAQQGIGHPNPMAVVWNELNAGRALIVGSLGHAVLLTAVQYTRSNMGVRTDAVVVRDPWPQSPNRRLFSLQEFQGTQFLATLRVY